MGYDRLDHQFAMGNLGCYNATWYYIKDNFVEWLRFQQKTK